MPLHQGKSKKTFSKNVEIEMHAGKPQKQALAIAYSVKRKNSHKKKMAEGGSISASDEKRPMPNDLHDDRKMESQNTGKKPAHMDSVTSRPDIAQSQRGPKTTRIKHPTMQQSPVFKIRMRDEEDDLQDSAGVNNGPQRQPPEHDNEIDADKSGHDIRDMEKEHSTHRKPYAKGGEIEASDEHHKLGGEHEDDLLDLPPSEDEGKRTAEGNEEIGQNRQGLAISDMEREHNNGRKPYAAGGAIGKFASMLAEGGEIEQEEEHHDSIAAAIMARRDRLKDEIDSGAHDLDEAVKMAEGGEIHSHDSIYSDDSDQADLSRNADEDANEEDQLSFNALRKENYSESEGLDELDSPRDSNRHGRDIDGNKHDMVEQIRRKMNSKRQFNR